MSLVRRIEWFCTVNSGSRGYTIGMSAIIGDGGRDGEMQVGIACRPFRSKQISQSRIAALLLKLQRDVLARHRDFNGESIDTATAP